MYTLELKRRSELLASRVNIADRLNRFDFDETTRRNLEMFQRDLGDRLDKLIYEFYEYAERFPDTRKILSGRDVALLKSRQREHWLRLLSGNIDFTYVTSATLVGLVHYDVKLPPHVYISSYNFFMSELIRVAGEVRSGYELQAIAISIGKAIMLDMSLVLNAYFLDSLSAKAAQVQMI